MIHLLFLLLFSSLGAMTFHVEHARTPVARARGLMGVKTLPENSGMLFHFPNEGRHTFWCGGCYIPLGVAYLDANGQILEIAKLKPRPIDFERARQEAYTPKQNSIYALEMQWFWFIKNNVRVGDRILINPSAPEQQFLKRVESKIQEAHL